MVFLTESEGGCVTEGGEGEDSQGQHQDVGHQSAIQWSRPGN